MLKVATVSFARLDIEVLHFERVVLNEDAPRLDLVAHENREQFLGADAVFDRHLQQPARSGFIVVSQSCSGFISPRPL